MDWGNAGLPAIFLDGETAPNPWTPPARSACTRAQAGIAVPVPTSTSVSSLNTAISNCSSANPSGSYLLLGSGTFFYGGKVQLLNNVTLRGAGPMSTTIALSGGALIDFANCCGGAIYGTVSGSPSAGATSVTIAGTTGTPVVNKLAWFNQCDTGWTGRVNSGTMLNTCNSGSYSDNGGIFVCSFSSSCDRSGGTPNANSQVQVVLVTSVTNNGGGSFTVGFTPGLYMPNWSSGNSMAFYSESNSAGSGYEGTGIGLEDLTVTFTYTANEDVYMGTCYACWVKGVRLIGAPSAAGHLVLVGPHCKNCLVMNNYFYGQNPPSSFLSVAGVNIDDGLESDTIIINNICEAAICREGEGQNADTVVAYNYSRDVASGYYQPTETKHDNGGIETFGLSEGNQFGGSVDDDTWGTHLFDTRFRNYLSCWDPPFLASATSTCILIDSYARFDNAIGNVVGDTSSGWSSIVGNYQESASNTNAEFTFNSGNSDSLALASSMRWGNYDVINAAVRWQSSEVPTSLSGNATAYENFVPSMHNLPCSFFISGTQFTTSPCSILMNGGTGLNWWKVCKSWTMFPTSCSSSQAQPFPPAGPDVTGGNHVNGYAYDIPAALAYQYLPIDSTYQGSFSITGSSWSGGTETLNVSGLPSGTQHIIGGFQMPGAPTVCNPSGGELVMTGSTKTTISYALASNPNTTCTGMVKWPDVRQFDENVYQSDSDVSSSVTPPTGLAAVVQ